MSEFGKVAVLMGGPSSEREVSLMSGKAVLAALLSRGVDAFAFDPAERSLLELPTMKVERVFIALHGRFGEDGTVQGALEVMGIPYTGSGVMASALALDKFRTKLIWKAAGIPTAAFELIADENDLDRVSKRVGFPMMIKPVHEGSTIGMTKVSDRASLATAYALARKYDSVVMAEAFIEGKEATVSILGKKALPIIVIEAPQGNYDYQNKYFTDVVKYHCPSHLPAALEAAIQRDTLRAFDLLGCRGWGRADVMIQPNGEYFFLEINTLPGMTNHSLVPIAARAVGLEMPDLCVEILRSAARDGGGVYVE